MTKAGGEIKGKGRGNQSEAGRKPVAAAAVSSWNERGKGTDPRLIVTGRSFQRIHMVKKASITYSKHTDISVDITRQVFFFYAKKSSMVFDPYYYTAWLPCTSNRFSGPDTLPSYFYKVKFLMLLHH